MDRTHTRFKFAPFTFFLGFVMPKPLQFAQIWKERFFNSGMLERKVVVTVFTWMAVFITWTSCSAYRTSWTCVGFTTTVELWSLKKASKWSSVYILKNGQGSSCFALLGPGRFKFLKSLKDENDLACLFLSPCPSLSLDQSGSGNIWGKETYLTRVPMTILLAYKNFYLFLSIEFI